MRYIKFNKIALISIMSFITAEAYSDINENTHTTIQLGGYMSSTGGTQYVGIQNLIGNDYVKNSGTMGNALFGLGYYWDQPETDTGCTSYGINGFFLLGSDVKGTIFQEKLYPNLSFQYSIANLPVYLAAKRTIKNDYYHYAITLDGGIGPNFIRTSKYQEQSLDGGITIPDNSFSGQNSYTFSATAGIGARLYNLFGDNPVECGYRFFYLGQGQLKNKNPQITNNLKTGQNYANALLCSMNF